MDGTGVPVDVQATGTRSLADLRTGRDGQVDAAIQALGSAPPPPAIQTTPTGVSATELDRLLEPFLPGDGTLPTNDRLRQTQRWQRLDFTHPNQLINQNGGAADPLNMQQIIRARGYQGSVEANYGGTAGDVPSVSVDVDLYAGSDGAHSALVTNDAPDLAVPITSPVQLGDESVAYTGIWLGEGSTEIMWRRGRVVFTVSYSDVPGFDRPESLTAMARLVDAQAQQTSPP
jgi:hypothetical protein